MKTSTLKEGVFPVAQEENTVFIGLTTPQGLNNEMTQLLNTRDLEGNPIIPTIRVGRPCEECRQKQILCIHAENVVPTGVSRKKRARYQRFYESDPHKFMREFQGEGGDDNTILFQQDWLLHLAEKDEKPVVGPIDFILMSIDPAQGGKCEWGACFCYYDVLDPGSQVIVQLDNFKMLDVQPATIKAWLRCSLNHVRISHEEFQNVPIVIACEAAPKIIGIQLQGYLRELIDEGHVYNVVMMNELDAKGLAEAGVPKTNANTQVMIKYSQNLLETGRVYFSEAFRTAVENRSKEEAKQEYLKQMGNFRIEKRVSPTTGDIVLKITGKGSGCNDDLGVAAIMNPYWYEYFYLTSNPRYTHIKQASNIWRQDRYVRFTHPVLHTDPKMLRAEQSLAKRQHVVCDEYGLY